LKKCMGNSQKEQGKTAPEWSTTALLAAVPQAFSAYPPAFSS